MFLFNDKELVTFLFEIFVILQSVILAFEQLFPGAFGFSKNV